MTHSREQTFSITPPQGAAGELQLLKAGNGLLKPDVWIVRFNGRATVWKSWDRRPSWERAVFGKWLAGREARVIRKLAGLSGFPEFVSQPHPWTVEMTLLNAESVPEIKRNKDLSPEYFERLWSMISEMHARCIVHGDLRRRNLLRSRVDHALPLIVDFTQCGHFRSPLRWPQRSIFEALKRVDRVTFLKLKKWYLELDQMTPEELRELEDVPWHLSLGRALRKKIYRPLRRMLTGRKGS
ncbi:hypothetical protein IT570_14055 [Candidatus Sumerlaeota bacterium]|nr:hypothetical protein [Candidatus Sumerlaeota bacterium]